MMTTQIDRCLSMPEGIEIFHLARSLRCVKGIAEAESWGKHLYIYGQDWTFGLSGRVAWRPEVNQLVKVNTGKVYGKVEECVAVPLRRGIDFCSASEEQLDKAVAGLYVGSRKALGALLLDQDCISGIGVAWGSEILHRKGLRPEVPASRQDLRGLSAAMAAVRDEALATYAAHAPDGVEGWFDSLYAVRVMRVYKKGTPVTTGGRTWWT